MTNTKSPRVRARSCRAGSPRAHLDEVGPPSSSLSASRGRCRPRSRCPRGGRRSSRSRKSGCPSSSVSIGAVATSSSPASSASLSEVVRVEIRPVLELSDRCRPPRSDRRSYRRRVFVAKVGIRPRRRRPESRSARELSASRCDRRRRRRRCSPGHVPSTSPTPSRRSSMLCRRVDVDEVRIAVPSESRGSREIASPRARRPSRRCPSRDRGSRASCRRRCRARTGTRRRRGSSPSVRVAPPSDRHRRSVAADREHEDQREEGAKHGHHHGSAR
jgi:hypothetical protein